MNPTRGSEYGTIDAPLSSARFVVVVAIGAGIDATLRTPAAVRRVCSVSAGKTLSGARPLARSVSRVSSPAKDQTSGVISRSSEGSRMFHS